MREIFSCDFELFGIYISDNPYHGIYYGTVGTSSARVQDYPHDGQVTIAVNTDLLPDLREPLHRQLLWREGFLPVQSRLHGRMRIATPGSQLFVRLGTGSHYHVRDCRLCDHHPCDPPRV